MEMKMTKLAKSSKLDTILGRAADGAALSNEEIIFLLGLEEKNDTERLFQSAREIRKRHFGDQVYLYGFIYFTTYCRNDCAFCFYRRSNSESKRYRKSPAEIIATAEKLTESGVHLLDLTMGEDPRYFSAGGFDELLETVAAVKRTANLPVMISPGVVPRDILDAFKAIGVEWYACYQETHNRELYGRLRLNQGFDERLELKKYARQIGFLIEEGLLAGIGESAEDLCHSFRVMDEIGADQVRVMSFIPQKGTPLENLQTMPRLREMLVIATMRLLFPDRLIPASLDVDGVSGLKQRLNAGANVVTSLIPPGRGLLGVSQSTLDIGDGSRTAAGIVPVLEECRLEPASRQNYLDWIERERSGRL
jgi:methylornithine synthase